ncbi:MAG: hypothetical protein C4576_11095 [Desulfobacteraceae bacterium]|nr:MAG: hypothetical protein C4576_11095 [Desulfobacteraceae bacterium]
MFKFLKLEIVHWDYWERFSLPLEADVITIVGPNGSGKTTLLDALRTLLCIDCSAGRDYKRYVRRNEKAFSWVRAVVFNERQKSGFRPFFPFLSDRVTLACRISKKGGDWQRQYLLADGEVEIEKLEENGNWIGVRDHRLRLEQAGLTPAIRRVLALEQGDTDKLCEYTPRMLLDLVFSVFGDQEVLDNYQKAKNEQMLIGQELEKLEEELHRLGASLLEAEARVRSFREWEDINKEIDTLSVEILPRTELADLYERIVSNRTPLRKRRLDLRARREKLDEFKRKMSDLHMLFEASKRKEEECELALKNARKDFDDRRVAVHDVERTLNEKKSLEELCRMQREGFDAPVLAAEQSERRERLEANKFELKTARDKLIILRERIAALKTGKRIHPEFVLDFRRTLESAGISHCLLMEIVEVVDPEWQKAMEGVLGPFAYIVLLRDPDDRRRAWELGEEMRYRHFVVAERSPLPEVMAGSMLEVVRFLETPPGWVAELLNRIRRVESVKDGSRLPKDVSWVTREGYHREYRGGRYIGVDAGKFRFGEAALRNMIAEAERESDELQARERKLSEENRILSRRIDDIQALLAGIDAAQKLMARSAEFAHAEKEFPALIQHMRVSQTILADCEGKLKIAQEERHELQSEQKLLENQTGTLKQDLIKEFTEFSMQRKQLVEKVVQYRTLRRPMPPRWYSRQARDELRTKYGSAEGVKSEIERLKKKLVESTWVTDPQVVEVRDKIKGDHSHLEETIQTRRIHHRLHVKATDEARESYINVLRATVRRYSHNVRSLGQLAGIDVAVEPPHLVNEDLALAQAGLNVKFDFDRKGMIGLNDGEASGGQQVMKSLILLVGLLMDETRTGGFVFIDEPFAHLDVFNIDRVGAFLEATRAQYVLTTPNTHNVNVFKKSDLTLVTQKRRHPEKWAPPVAFLRRERENK